MIKTEGKFTYIEKGEGFPLILLHGLMGGVDNFGSMVDVVADAGFKVLAPDLKLFKVLEDKLDYIISKFNIGSHINTLKRGYAFVRDIKNKSFVSLVKNIKSNLIIKEKI